MLVAAAVVVVVAVAGAGFAAVAGGRTAPAAAVAGTLDADGQLFQQRPITFESLSIVILAGSLRLRSLAAPPCTAPALHRPPWRSNRPKARKTRK